MAGGDVEEAKLVRARRVIDARLLDGIARINEVDEVDSLHDAPAGDVEARDHANPDAHARAIPSAASSLSVPS